MEGSSRRLASETEGLVTSPATKAAGFPKSRPGEAREKVARSEVRWKIELNSRVLVSAVRAESLLSIRLALRIRTSSERLSVPSPGLVISLNEVSRLGRGIMPRRPLPKSSPLL